MLFLSPQSQIPVNKNYSSIQAPGPTLYRACKNKIGIERWDCVIPRNRNSYAA